MGSPSREVVASRTLAMTLALVLAACSGASPERQKNADMKDVTENDVRSGDSGDESSDVSEEPERVRIATFNASLYRDSKGALIADLKGGDDEQAKRVAKVIQTQRPDILLVNEFDWDADGEAARIFREKYLEVGQGGAEPIRYEHVFIPKTNTGLHSGVDLDGNGEVDDSPGDPTYGADAFGFGVFEGQYGMLILSRYPIREDEIRTFQTFLWNEMPENLLPGDYYSEEAADVLRLSSKNHVDVPVDVGGPTIHLLASHPTPPAFDGPEDRNGRRNHDEIRFWVDYVSGGDDADYIHDDSGARGGLSEGASFVIAGDLNSDPKDGDSRREALLNLLGHDRVSDPEPTSEGAELAASADGGANSGHQGDSALDTADFSDDEVGNLRVDYVLPSAGLKVVESGVFWPPPSSEQSDLADVSDHHLVRIDIELPEE